MRRITIVKLGATALVGFFVAAQVFRIDKTNLVVEADLSAPISVKDTMRRSCYGCHSNETVWPWYSNVAPASWLVAYDVREGRAALNLSSWANTQRCSG